VSSVGRTELTVDGRRELWLLFLDVELYNCSRRRLVALRRQSLEHALVVLALRPSISHTSRLYSQFM